ncbi:hypothetical protein DBB29_01955 [Pandoraea cepalis]|uniref:Uncharacterized protein n=1 Tax=Pandoraea cepalis TaxID=2508294 RepID=A0AAW7MI25_9BURK|nr:hypothetical protein [Pandoraea cepalis]MDN4576887.1 hypothetical protein [Pandoraea cepalis]
MTAEISRTITIARLLSAATESMQPINFMYRGCFVNIEISEQVTLWEITIRVNPRDGVELIEPIGVRSLKLPKTKELDVIQNELIDEIQLAIDHRLVGC